MGWTKAELERMYRAELRTVFGWAATLVATLVVGCAVSYFAHEVDVLVGRWVINSEHRTVMAFGMGAIGVLLAIVSLFGVVEGLDEAVATKDLLRRAK